MKIYHHSIPVWQKSQEAKTYVNEGNTTHRAARDKVTLSTDSEQRAKDNDVYTRESFKLKKASQIEANEEVREVKPLIIEHKTLNSKAAQAFQTVAEFEPTFQLVDTYA